MKFMDIARLAKARKYIRIITDESDEQWASIGNAAYRLEGVPRMESESFLALAGVSQKQRESWFTDDTMDTMGLFNGDRYGEYELTADDAGLSVQYNGHHLTPLYHGGGVIWVDVDLMSPIVRSRGQYLSFHTRRGCGQKTIAVKDGLILIALVGEFEMDKGMFAKIALLYKQCHTEVEGGLEEGEA